MCNGYENSQCEVQDEITRVYFRDISDEEIRAYIRTEEPMDKAGAYGIQGMGAVFVDQLKDVTSMWLDYR